MLAAPEFLLVDLMFYEYVPDPEGGYGMPRKLNSHCKPLENIEIPVPGGSRQYSLEGIVEHLGTEMVGSVNHYISYIIHLDVINQFCVVQITIYYSQAFLVYSV